MTDFQHIVASNRRPSRLRTAVAIGLLALAGTAALGTTTATAAKERENHCITASGVDLNDLFGVSEQIVAPGSPSCTEVGSGESWSPNPFVWVVNRSFEVVPDGFEPAAATPLEDFVAKLTEVRYVIDPGTKHERSYVFPNEGNVWTGTWRGPGLNGFPAVSTVTLGALRPLPPGEHVVQTTWVFSAVHCDGFGEGFGPGGHCLGAGETTFSATAFEVTPGRF